MKTTDSAISHDERANKRVVNRQNTQVTSAEIQGRILVADDDPHLCRIVKVVLEMHGYLVVVAHDGYEALQNAERDKFDLVILDIMMPFIDGFSVCERLRQQSDIAIMILSARSGQDDILHGFALGADDYIHKPFDSRELLARVKAVLRRTNVIRRQDRQNDLNKEFLLDQEHRRLTIKDREIELTPTEFQLLHFLSSHPGKIFARETLFSHVWNAPYIGDSNIVDVCVRRLREKIEDIPSAPRFILTVRGFGYKFRDKL